MNITKIIISIILAGSILATTNIFSQQQCISNVFSKTTQDSVRRYSQVITNSMSSDLNSGLYQVMKNKNLFSVYFGLKAFGSILNTNEKLPGAFKNISLVPLAMLQLGVGTFANSDVFMRYLPKIKANNYGSVEAWGIGMQHNLTGDFKKIPFEIVFQASIHHMSINDLNDDQLFNLNSWSMNVMVAKRFGVLKLYSVLQYEKSNSDLNYTDLNSTPRNINMQFESNNNERLVIGFNLRLGPLNFNTDYSYAKLNSVSTGIGLLF
jgi:hypothetical protein